MINHLKKYIAEFLGAFAIVLFGTGAIIINQEFNGIVTHLGISITFGAIVMVMIYAFGKISGAHFNPAVTLSLLLAGKFSFKDTFPYLISQISGGVIASLFLKLFFPQNELLGSTMPRGSNIESFLFEFGLTFALMLAIYFMAFSKVNISKYTGLVVGVIVFLEAYFAGPICGASMNPARSIGPALISGHLEFLWIYIIAPIIGAMGAFFVWKAIKINLPSVD